MAKEINSQMAEEYLRKADEFYDTALKALEDGKLDAATFNATQAVFLANDAFCIHFLGRRASKDHREAVSLHMQAARAVSDTSKRSMIVGVFDERSQSGYTERFIKEPESRRMVIHSGRFIAWVRDKMRRG